MSSNPFHFLKPSSGRVPPPPPPPPRGSRSVSAGRHVGGVVCGVYPVYPTTVPSWSFPLVNTTVHYDLVYVHAMANVVQTFTSDISTAVEIKYVFPLPPDSSVCAFKAVIDDEHTIKGIVKPKAKAKAEYEAAISKDKAAALLEQGNVEVFQLSLGNIKPEQTIEIHISFACTISHNGDLNSLRLTFPCIIAPRYGAGPQDFSVNVSTQALDFSVSAQMTSYIKSITSPSHPIKMKLGQSTAESMTAFDPFKAHVSLSSSTLLEKDIVVSLTCEDLDKPHCTVESFIPDEGAKEHTYAYALTLVPRFELPSLPSQEYIFLVDRSGSMEGAKIAAVRSALQIMLRSLPQHGTSFNIMSFGSRHTLFWPSSMAYTAENVEHASAHVDTIDANYGGTEIRAALDVAFRSRSDSATPASVFVLTDGEAYDLDGVQATVADAISRSKASNSLLRLFCLGIGNAVS
ncbi:hypothetical protein M422DRAFT_191319, partial [Sphaerobolus stellatus SS14]